MPCFISYPIKNDGRRYGWLVGWTDQLTDRPTDRPTDLTTDPVPLLIRVEVRRRVYKGRKLDEQQPKLKMILFSPKTVICSVVSWLVFFFPLTSSLLFDSAGIRRTSTASASRASCHVICVSSEDSRLVRAYHVICVTRFTSFARAGALIRIALSFLLCGFTGLSTNG